MSSNYYGAEIGPTDVEIRPIGVEIGPTDLGTTRSPFAPMFEIGTTATRRGHNRMGTTTNYRRRGYTHL